jgi:nitroimidazol reductase NimA-like FMN-containing flavoprotein (pyridoxamine 5'-phosphate oxidase superfamily)
MAQIDLDILEAMVNEQETSALGLVTPKGRPHCTPIWTHYFEGKLYIFSRKSRAKIRYAQQVNECMIAFDFGSVRGTIQLIEKGSDEYNLVYNLPNKRYSHDTQLEQYKENWDVALMITPTKLFR